MQIPLDTSALYGQLAIERSRSALFLLSQLHQCLGDFSAFFSSVMFVYNKNKTNFIDPKGKFMFNST